MAQMGVTLSCELDLCHDAINEIRMIMHALVKCHGAPYRALQRRIERLVDQEVSWGEPKTHMIGGGRVVFEPWPEMKAIIQEARDLQVLS